MGRERQRDTYFNTSRGRLKIREAGQRAYLVWYFRADALRSKRSDVILLPLSQVSATKTILARELGIMVVVDKIRRVYLKQNVRIHLDKVRGLGTFVEIESVGPVKDFPRLKRQAEAMAEMLGLRRRDLIRGSYSDLLTQGRKATRFPDS